MEYELQQRARAAVQKNWTQFLLMDTFDVLNTNVIVTQLHVSQKQRVEAIRKQEGDSHANSELLKLLVKYEKCGRILFEAFKELGYKGVHGRLAQILQNELKPPNRPIQCNSSSPSDIGGEVSSNLTMQSSVQAQETNANPVNSNITQADQLKISSEAGPHDSEKKSVQEIAKSNEKHLTELASPQNNVIGYDSPSCNVSNGGAVANLQDSQNDVNKAHAMKDKAGKSKVMSPLLNESTNGPNDNRSECVNEEESLSFVVSDSAVEEAFNQSHRFDHNIEDLKYPNSDCDTSSVTLVKETMNGENNFNMENTVIPEAHVIAQKVNITEVGSECNGNDTSLSIPSSNFIDLHSETNKSDQKQISHHDLSIENERSEDNFDDLKALAQNESESSNRSCNSLCQPNESDEEEDSENTFLKTIDTENSAIQTPVNAFPNDGINVNVTMAENESKVLNDQAPDSALPTDVDYENNDYTAEVSIIHATDNAALNGDNYDNETSETDVSAISNHDSDFSKDGSHENKTNSSRSNARAPDSAFPSDSNWESEEADGIIHHTLTGAFCDSDESGAVGGRETQNSNSHVEISRFQSVPARWDNEQNVSNQTDLESHNQIDEMENHSNVSSQRTTFDQRSNSMPAEGFYSGFIAKIMNKKIQFCKGTTGSF